jgi:transposase
MRGECPKAKRKRRKFTPEFKAEAVRLYQVGDRSAGQVTRDLDLTETALREWVRRAEADQSPAPKETLTTAGARNCRRRAGGSSVWRSSERY